MNCIMFRENINLKNDTILSNNPEGQKSINKVNKDETKQVNLD